MPSKSAWTFALLAAIALVQPYHNASADEAGCLVVGVWGEARGEPIPVIEAVVSTIVNRARARGLSVCDAVMDPAALTGVTPAMHELFSQAASPHGSITEQPHTGHDRDQLAAVQTAAAAALAGTLPDRSKGATHFYSPAGMRDLGLSAAPSWAASMVHTATVGPFVFLREKGLLPPAQSNLALSIPTPLRNFAPSAADEAPSADVGRPIADFDQPTLSPLPAPGSGQAASGEAVDVRPGAATVQGAGTSPFDPTQQLRSASQSLADIRAARGADADVEVATLQPVDIAPVMLNSFAIRRPMELAHPVEFGPIVLDAPHFLEAEAQPSREMEAPPTPLLGPADERPVAAARFSIVSQAAAAELPSQTQWTSPDHSQSVDSRTQPTAQTNEDAIDDNSADPPAPVSAMPQQAAAPAPGYWNPPPFQSPSWAPAAASIPQQQPIPAVGYWSPQPGLWLVCRGAGRPIWVVAVDGYRVRPSAVRGARCGM